MSQPDAQSDLACGERFERRRMHCACENMLQLTEGKSVRERPSMLCIGWVRNQRTTTALSVPHKFQSAHPSSSQCQRARPPAAPSNGPENRTGVRGARTSIITFALDPRSALGRSPLPSPGSCPLKDPESSRICLQTAEMAGLADAMPLSGPALRRGSSEAIVAASRRYNLM